MKGMMRIGILFCFLTASYMGSAQEYFRMEGEFTIKSKNDSTGNLTMGNFYYDKNEKKIIYHITFPKEQLWVFADTSVYRFEEGKLLDRTKGPAIHEFSIFSLAANNQLANYGLKNSLYKLEKVEKEGNSVLTTWAPPLVLKDLLGKVIISNQNKRIMGIVFFDKDEVLVRKQFFREYKNIEGLEFPTEIVDMFILPDEGTTYQKTTYKNIKVNDEKNSSFHNYKLPAGYESLLAN